MRITDIQDDFIRYKLVEEEVSPETIIKYNDCIKRFIGLEGDLDLGEITTDHFFDLKYQLQSQDISPARISSVIFCMRSLFRYIRETRHLSVPDPVSIKPPRRNRKEIVYLTNSEIQRFLDTIDSNSICGLRFRAWCEVLLDTGARISEILQLDRDNIIKTSEISYANIIGKGNKPRKIYFSSRSLFWLDKYLKARTDDNPALFVSYCHCVRMKRDTLWRDFKKASELSGINKNVTSHILRHTFCTNLLINGAGIVHIQKLAGHEDINTTIRHYASLDDKAIIDARQKYLNYDI